MYVRNVASTGSAMRRITAGSRSMAGWRSAVVMVQPDTVARWHKRAFKLYSSRKSRSDKRGRPAVDPGARVLIFQMAGANSTWGVPKIYGVLLRLGLETFERAVLEPPRRYRLKPPP